MSEMIDKVNILLNKYNGGEIFFDELDNSIRLDRSLIETLYNHIHATPLFNSSKYHPQIVVSGKTGLAIHNYGFQTDIILPGGLRKNDVDLSDYEKFFYEGFDYIFVDDSYFLGRTEAVVQNLVKSKGGIYRGTFVAYDGCQERRSRVHSLYRYYDHYDVLGKKKEQL